MTIHKAKGLEWEMVLLPGIHRLSARDPWPLLNWLELPTRAPDGRRDVLLAPLPSSGGEAGQLNEYIRNVRRQSSSAEVKRLLYVAATRARTTLEVFAWPDLTKQGQPSRISDTLYGVAEPAIQKTTATVAEMKPSDIEDIPEPLALAAVAEETAPAARQPMYIRRLASEYDPLKQLHASSLPLQTSHRPAQMPRLPRPEGSFGARTVGNVTHAFIERLLHEFATSTESSGKDLARKLLNELPSWQNAIQATLAAGGLPPDEVQRARTTVSRAIKSMLESAE